MDDDGPKPRKLTEQQLWVAVVCEVTGWNSKTMGGRAAKLAAKIRNSGGSKEDVLAHYGQHDFGEAWWWYRDHWLGKKGERPSDRWILETWGVWNKAVAVQLPAAREAEPAGFAALRAFREARQER